MAGKANKKITAESTLGAHWFKVIIRPGLSGKIEEGAFRSVKGISKKFEVEPVTEGGRNYGIHALRKGPASHGEVTLEQGILDSDALWKWCVEVQQGGKYRRTVTIHQMSHGGTKVARTFVLKRAWPVEWTAPDLGSASADLAVDTLKIAYEDLTVGGHKAGKDPTPKAKIKQTEGGGATVNFTFNPSSITLGRNLNWQPSKKSGNENYPALNPNVASYDTLDISGVLFDASEKAGGSVSGKVAALHRLALNFDIGGKKRPPRVRFEWQSTKFYGVISSFKAEYTLFNDSGKPVRAKITLQLTGQALTEQNSSQKLPVAADG